MKPRTLLLFVILLALGLALAGVAQAAPTDPGIAVSAERSNVRDATSPAPFASLTAGSPQTGATATPHPILSDVRVRRAIAYCTDKAGMLAVAHPSLTPEQRQALIADTFIRPTSWAYTAPATTYPYAPATGQALLDEAGWALEQGASYRTQGGKELVLTLRTTTGSFRDTVLPVFEAQMRDCGIRVIREHLDPTWLFGRDALTGIQVRDFELSDYAGIVPDSDPDGQTVFACDAVPAPANGWKGENYTGWCNADASAAIVTATDPALSQAQRKAAYAVVIDAAAADLPYLPLFWRLDPITGQVSEAWEHIDFNLETFSQDAELAPATATTLNTTDYAGNTGSVQVPAGAVVQNTTLSYYPLVASAYAAPQGKSLVRPFRLTAALQGVPQATFAFNTPVILTVRYDDADLSSIWDEAALNLYRWVEGAGWQPAQESCPEGQRNYQVDRATNTIVVHICHLSEYALIGGTKHVVYLPLVMRNWDPLLYDDFNNPAFDGAYDPALWALSGSSAFSPRQQNGVLVFSNASDLGSDWNCGTLRLKKPQQRTLAQLQQFEARWRFASDLSGGRAYIEMNFQSWSFDGHVEAAACVIYADYGSQPMLECSVGGDLGRQYGTGLQQVAYDTWYTVRIEADPLTANLGFYLDNNLIGNYTPSQAAGWLAADDFRSYLAACNRDSGTFNTRYLDDVRITPAQ